MWFTSALLCLLCWGTADLFYKKGSAPNDRHSHLKIAIAVGLVMGVQAIYMLLFVVDSYDPMDLIIYLPVSSMYILSMVIGYVGLRYLEVSLSSPLSNTSGAIAAVLAFFIMGQRMNSIQFIAVIMITVGVVSLSFLENRYATEESDLKQSPEERHYRLGALALIFPLLYALIDSLGTFLDGVYLNENDPILSEDSALISYELTFLIVAIVIFIYLSLIKKQRFEIPKEKDKFLAALFETIGQFFYVPAMASNAIIVPPMIASYAIVSVLLGRIVLKEKLTRAQYSVIAVIMVAIAMLGFYDG
ncbi:MAG: EamA family transporter [Bavariicoccus seileri]|uniref:DMT family transporter n=1 Tax=Bavariicoccus seileri TaxID=549685 RepID=UPI0003B70E95|nr:DMT family transporter [Bavariicoccus seileri]